MTLTITLSFAAAAALLNIWLAVRVSQLRIKGRASIGDGGDPALTARMRAHANFVEYTPFAVILVGLIELAQGGCWWLWAVTAVFIVARISHALGMDRPAPNPFRLVGIALTLAVLLGLAGWAVVVAYQGTTRIAAVKTFEFPPQRAVD